MGRQVCIIGGGVIGLASAYALVRDGKDLYWWHYLVSGDTETVHHAGISARGRTVSEADVDGDDFEDYVVDWPLTVGERAGEKERT